MSEHTPTTSDVRIAYDTAQQQDRDVLYADSCAEFNRWFTAEIRKAKAEALREAAKGLQINTWMDLFEGPLQQRIASSQSVVDWLRSRADQIEADNE